LASYIDRILADGEMVVHRSYLSLWSQSGLIAAGILLLALFGAGLILLLWAWLIYRTTELAVTNKRIISKTGIIRRSTMEMRLEKIESITVDQGVLGRMLNFGSITIAGTGGEKTPIRSIADPLAFQKYFMSAADANRKADE
jgi:uncharacterized membrane protein YdbT with pleckstrin-like domain